MAKPRKMQRQLLWNFRVNAEEQNARYVFVIVNDSRETPVIKSRLIEALAPVDNVVERTGKSGANPYHIIVFDSQKRIFSFSPIYKGKVTKDTRLYERKTDGMNGLETYIATRLSW